MLSWVSPWRMKRRWSSGWWLLVLLALAVVVDDIVACTKGEWGGEVWQQMGGLECVQEWRCCDVACLCMRLVSLLVTILLAERYISAEV